MNFYDSVAKEVLTSELYPTFDGVSCSDGAKVLVTPEVTSYVKGYTSDWWVAPVEEPVIEDTENMTNNSNSSNSSDTSNTTDLNTTNDSGRNGTARNLQTEDEQVEMYESATVELWFYLDDLPTTDYIFSMYSPS